MNKLKKLGLYLWQLPQNIIGRLLFWVYSGYTTKIDDNAIVRISCKMRGGITLGKYIIVRNSKYIKHEYGHTIQSKYLGPLYLLVIGLPSILHAAVHRTMCKSKDYYHFYTEKWANKLSDKYYKYSKYKEE